jgi:signal transduction histidine kinase
MLSMLLARVTKFIGNDNSIQKIRVGALFGLTFGGSFAVFNLLTHGLETLGVLELTSLIVFALPAYILAKEKGDAQRSNSLLVLCAMTYLGSLIVVGGVKETGLYWVYVFPFVAFFLKGLRVGWIFCLTFLAMACVYLLILMPAIPESHQYLLDVRVHFLTSLLFYTLVAAAFSYLQDISDKRILTAKEAAESAYHAKSRFLAAASHDIRQPAHALGMFVARLSNVSHDPETRLLIEGVEASVRSLQEMLDVFFDYSKLDSESLGMSLKPVSISQMFEQLRLSFSSIASAKGLSLRIRKSDAWVLSDKVLLHRVLLNLVSNAVKYTERGKILIVCRPAASKSQVRIEVWDTGIGIADSELEMIFEEFYQIDNPERDRSKGLGLGLSMVKKSCDLLNHSLRIKSCIGRGTRFSVTVPMTPDAHYSKEVTISEFLVDDIKFKYMQVMVIEDDPLSNQAITGLLTSWGCQVSAFHDADRACESIATNPIPDIIVSDYRLPGLKSGIDAVRIIRDMCGVRIPSILISGDKNDELLKLATAQGLVLLTKPLQPAKLRSLLRRL